MLCAGAVHAVAWHAAESVFVCESVSTQVQGSSCLAVSGGVFAGGRACGGGREGGVFWAGVEE